MTQINAATLDELAVHHAALSLIVHASAEARCTRANQAIMLSLPELLAAACDGVGQPGVALDKGGLVAIGVHCMVLDDSLDAFTAEQMERAWQGIMRAYPDLLAAAAAAGARAASARAKLCERARAARAGLKATA